MNLEKGGYTVEKRLLSMSYICNTTFVHYCSKNAFPTANNYNIFLSRKTRIQSINNYLRQVPYSEERFKVVAIIGQIETVIFSGVIE